MKGSRFASHALVIGVTASSLLLIAGLVRSVGAAPAPPLHASSLVALPAAMARMDAGAIIHLGLLVLMATPIARVLVLAVAFFRQKERSLFFASILVLLLLGASAALGFMQAPQ